jgi:hypothetical protein
MKIYRIVDNTNGNIYIGKTIQTLNKRLSEHKSHKLCSSREILKNGDYKIELIEETEDPTRERYWILNTDCINQNIPGRTKKESNKEWYENNKDKNKEYKKYINSMGGDTRYNNNLLKIDVNLFNLN